VTNASDDPLRTVRNAPGVTGKSPDVGLALIGFEAQRKLAITGFDLHRNVLRMGWKPGHQKKSPRGKTDGR
jgi:hypothetical protein